MTDAKGNKNKTIIAIVLILAFIFTAGFFVRFPITQTNIHPSLTWGNWVQQYNGALGVGTFVQTLDDGFAIVGTSTDQNLMLIRTNGTRAEEWRKTYGPGFGNALTLTPDGGFVIAGAKTSGSGTDAQNASWIIKTDPDGNTLWSKEYEGNGFSGIVNASDGGYVMLGRFNLTGTEKPGLLKIDSTGNVQWTKTYASSEADTLALYTLISTNDDGYALVGEMRYPVYDVVMQNGWFLKTDANGETQINRPFTMDGWTVLHSVIQANDGSYLLVGATTNSTNNPYSACMIYTNSDGHAQWSQTNATLKNDSPIETRPGFEYYSVAKTTNGNFIVLGYLKGSGITAIAIKGSSEILTQEISGVATVNTSVNYVIRVVQGGFAYVGYSNGTIRLVEEYAYTTTV